jgi:hypothetical protein
MVAAFMARRAAGEYSDHMSVSLGTLLMAPSSGTRKFSAALHSIDLMPRLSTTRIGTRRNHGRRDRGVAVVCARGTTTGSVRSMMVVGAIVNRRRRGVAGRGEGVMARLRRMRASRGDVVCGWAQSLL